MGCNQSKSQAQSISIALNLHKQQNKIKNSTIIHQESPKQETINHQNIFFQQNDTEGDRQKANKYQQREYIFEAEKQANPIKQTRNDIELLDIQINDVPSLITAIELDLDINPFYTNIFDTSHLKEVLLFLTKHNLSKQFLYLGLKQLINFMESCNAVGKEQTQLKIQSFKPIIINFATEWSKIKQAIIEQKQQSQRFLSFFISKQNKQQTCQSYNYLNLTFQKDFTQSGKLLQKLQQMITQDPNIFCLYTDYLIKCCESLKNSGRKALQIGILLQEHCQLIHNRIENDINTFGQMDNSDQCYKYHQNFKQKLQSQQKRYYELDSQSVLSKQQQFQQYVKDLLGQIESIYCQLLDFCNEVSRGQQFLLVADKITNDQKIVFELKMSTFKYIQFQKYSPLEMQGESYCSFIQNQLFNLRKQMQSIFEFMSGKIQFKGQCMLKVRHVFDSISILNRCGDRVKQQINKKHYLLMQIVNNLHNSKQQRCLIIIFAINLHKIQIKLVLNYNLFNMIVKEFLQSILHSKMVSSLTSLHLLNNRLTHKLINRYPFVKNNGLIIKKQEKSQIVQGIELKKLMSIWSIKQLNGLQENQNQLQNHSYLIKLKVKLMSLRAHKFIIKDQQKLLKLYNKIVFKLLQPQTTNFDLQLQLFKAYINKQRSQYRDDKNQEAIRSIVGAYLKFLVIYAQMQLNKKNYSKVQLLINQSKQLQLIWYKQYVMEIFKLRKIQALCEFNKNNYNQALRLFSECIQSMKKQDINPNKVQLLRLQRQMAIILKEQGNSFKALSLLNDILTQIYAQEIKEDQLQSSVLRNIAELLINTNQYEDSHIYLSKCLKIKQKNKVKNSIQSIPILISIGQVFEMQGRYEEALNQYKKCEHIIKMRKDQKQFMLSDVLKRIAKVYIQLLFYKQAQQTLIVCLNLIQSAKGVNSGEYGDVSFLMGKLYIYLKNYQTSLNYLLKTLSIIEKNNGKQTVQNLQVLKQIVKVYKGLQKYKDQEHFMNKINKIIERENQKLNISHLNTYNNIADKSQIRGNYAVALDYYHKSILILDKLKKKRSIQAVQIHQNIANIYRQQQHFSAAQQNYRKSLEILQIIKGKDSVQGAEVICQIGLLNQLQGKTDVALDYYLKCYNLCLRFRVKYRVYAVCCYRLGKFYLGMDQEKETVKYWKECLPLLEKMLAKQIEEVKEKLKELQAKYNILQI